MIFIPVGLGIVAIAYAVCRWCSKKVDKAGQEEDANQDTQHAIVDVQIQNPIAV
jgi:hypothetical protein